MTATSANSATRELHHALREAGLRDQITNFWSRTGDGDVRTVVVIPDPTDLELLARVREVVLDAFPDIVGFNEIHPGNRDRGGNVGTKLAFGFERPLPGWSS